MLRFSCGRTDSLLPGGQRRHLWWTYVLDSKPLTELADHALHHVLGFDDHLQVGEPRTYPKRVKLITGRSPGDYRRSFFALTIRLVELGLVGQPRPTRARSWRPLSSRTCQTGQSIHIFQVLTLSLQIHVQHVTIILLYLSDFVTFWMTLWSCYLFAEQHTISLLMTVKSSYSAINASLAMTIVYLLLGSATLR